MNRCPQTVIKRREPKTTDSQELEPDVLEVSQELPDPVLRIFVPKFRRLTDHNHHDGGRADPSRSASHGRRSMIQAWMSQERTSFPKGRLLPHPEEEA